MSLVRIMMKNNNLNEDLSYPFASLIGRLKMVKSEQEIETLFKNQGWENATDFAVKADRILKAYRVNYLGVPQAIQINKIRAYPTSAPTTEVLENLRTYAKMHEAKPGDVYFVEPYLQDIRKKLKPDFILMLGYKATERKVFSLKRNRIFTMKKQTRRILIEALMEI